MNMLIEHQFLGYSHSQTNPHQPKQARPSTTPNRPDIFKDLNLLISTPNWGKTFSGRLGHHKPMCNRGPWPQA